MYIEYITPQRVADPIITMYNPKLGDYIPTWLVRTFDWEKVPGHEAINGYHTLSYCWEQSGEKFQKEDGEYDLHDDGHHRVTKQKGEQFVTYEVTYDQLLQQICKDFDIEYLWYDKICIDQTNKEEKQREIKQMHLIYSNARYTVALVPEIYIDDPKDFDTKVLLFECTEAKSTAEGQMRESLWWKRSWTLEEVMVSTRLLVIGRNIHFWSLAEHKQGKVLRENDGLSYTMLGFLDRKVKSANQVLSQAHFRTSTKEHDKIFALANILHGIITIDIDYDHDFSTVMNSFYQQLAQRDLSIMCFGANVFSWTGEPERAPTMSSYNLPSWTGITGSHPDCPIVDIALGENGFYSIDDRMGLHIRCRSYTIQPTQYDSHFVLYEESAVQADNNYYRVINSMNDFHGDETAALDWSQLCMLKAAMNYTHYTMLDAVCCSPILPLSLTESSDECVVLGVLFAATRPMFIDNVIVGNDYYYLSPVVVKSSTDNPTYKVLGAILLKKFLFKELLRKSPDDFMDEMFDELGRSEYQDFCIK